MKYQTYVGHVRQHAERISALAPQYQRPNGMIHWTQLLMDNKDLAADLGIDLDKPDLTRLCKAVSFLGLVNRKPKTHKRRLPQYVQLTDALPPGNPIYHPNFCPECGHNLRGRV